MARLSLGGREGMEVAIGLAVHGKRALSPPACTESEGRRRTPRQRSSEGPVRALQGLNDSIIATATEAMGRPYAYGGTGEDGEGFDCSGLIQYSYAKHGIELPRRSTDQAREGRKIERRLKLLVSSRYPDLLESWREGEPRGSVHRRWTLYSQRHPGSAGQHAEPGRPLRPVVVQALGRSQADRPIRSPALTRGSRDCCVAD